MFDILILRHGQTEWNRQGRLQGRLDSPLTEAGRAQALRQGEILRKTGVDAAWRFLSSPQGRARETARLALSGIVAEPQLDDRLCEIDVGEWSGLTRDEIVRRGGAGRSDGWFALMDRAPGGEGFAGVQARVRSLLADLDGPTVVVTHGILSQFLRGTLLKLDFAAMAALPERQGVVYRMSAGGQEELA